MLKQLKQLRHLRPNF